jgi:hypothetical protein
MGLAKRKGTKGIKHISDDFDQIQREFLGRITENVKLYNIPDNLIINWDQTASNYVPVSSWTMQEKGSKQVSFLSLLISLLIRTLLIKPGHSRSAFIFRFSSA